MPYAYTVAEAVTAATNKTLSAAVVTEIIGDASKSLSHADAHIKSEDFWTTQRKTKSGAAVGTTEATDSHLKAEYKKRSEHSMFDSAISSVEAITAALNTEIGKLALTELLGRPDDSDGVDLYSRTAVATLAGTKQINRANPTGTAADPATLNKVDAEYVVVCLRKTKLSYLVFASAYPVAVDPASQGKEPGNDWFQGQKNKTMVRALAKTSPPIVPW